MWRFLFWLNLSLALLNLMFLATGGNPVNAVGAIFGALGAGVSYPMMQRERATSRG